MCIQLLVCANECDATLLPFSDKHRCGLGSLELLGILRLVVFRVAGLTAVGRFTAVMFMFSEASIKTFTSLRDALSAT